MHLLHRNTARIYLMTKLDTDCDLQNGINIITLQQVIYVEFKYEIYTRGILQIMHKK